jgi:hypothetical protein
MLTRFSHHSRLQPTSGMSICRKELGCCLAALALLLLLTCPVLAEGRRVALVIGNADYTVLPKLPNSLNDAEDMAAVLRELRFEVIIETNADLSRMRQSINHFVQALDQDSVAVVYFTGHGVAPRQASWMIPVEANVAYVEDLPSVAYSIDDLVKRLGLREGGTTLIVLDACSDTRLPSRTGQPTGGLARIPVPKGTLIAYAADIHQFASSGYGRNSLFTQELLKVIRLPGLSVQDIFGRAGDAVREISRDRQNPIQYGSLGTYYLAEPPVGRQQARPSVLDLGYTPQTGSEKFLAMGIQTRAFDTADREGLLRLIISTLQDLGFFVDGTDPGLGSVSGTRLDDSRLRLTIRVRRRGQSQLAVGASVTYSVEKSSVTGNYVSLPSSVDDPQPYEQFFAALSQTLNLRAQTIIKDPA